MDTGKHNNTIFYDGYEGEGEITLSMSNPHYPTVLHIWDGYFEEIFGKPSRTDTEWSGFTKDYQEGTRTFSGETHIPALLIPEYLTDLTKYENLSFSYPETKDCLCVLIDFFTKALQLSSEVTVTSS